MNGQVHGTPTGSSPDPREPICQCPARAGGGSRGPRLQPGRADSRTVRRRAGHVQDRGFCPLFSAFGPEPIRVRLGDGASAGARDHGVALSPQGCGAARGAAGLGTCCSSGPAGADEQRGVRRLSPADGRGRRGVHHRADRSRGPRAAALHERHTGTPKGAVHVHQAVVAHHITGKLALDLHPEDVFWCTADPLWVTGTSYGIIAPLTNGVTSIVDEAEFDARRWYGILQDQKVSVWYTAPTAIRMLMKSGLDLAKEFDVSALRFLASVGQPLNPEAVVWGRGGFGRPFHDNWWRAETDGMVMPTSPPWTFVPLHGAPAPCVQAAIVRGWMAPRGGDGGARCPGLSTRGGRRCSGLLARARPATASASPTGSTDRRSRAPRCRRVLLVHQDADDVIKIPVTSSVRPRSRASSWSTRRWRRASSASRSP